MKPLFQPNQPVGRQYLTVSQLNRMAKSQLEQHLGQVWLEGEISNFSAPASGHWYFSLKDEKSQIRCAMFKNRSYLAKFRPTNGQSVLIKAKATVYEARGEFQLVVDFIEPAGIGALQLEFERLKAKLTAQGLFAAERKKPVPSVIQCVGIITSPTGAAIKDVLTVMQRRFPLTQIIIYPAQVQGKEAHHTLIQALQTANQRNECDLLLLTRGGGSMEDLWCFNHQDLAYAIAESQLPVISAIGHQIDFTIADFVADLRAATPSAAAELITRDQDQLRQKLDDYHQLLNQKINEGLNTLESQINYLAVKLSNPDPLLKLYHASVEQFKKRMRLTLEQKLARQQNRLSQLHVKLLK